MSMFASLLFCVVVYFEQGDCVGDWIRAWPRKWDKPTDDMCFPKPSERNAGVKRWGFSPLIMLAPAYSDKLTGDDPYRTVEGVVNDAAGKEALITAIKTATSSTDTAAKFVTCPDKGYVGDPLQRRDNIAISVHMQWDTETGQPSEDRKSGDTWMTGQCQQWDQPAAPPQVCLMLHDTNVTDKVALPCSGGTAAFFLQGGTGAIPLTPALEVKELAGINEVQLMPTLDDSYAALASDPNGARYKEVTSFCCTKYALPTRTAGKLTQEWEIPYMKVFMEGTFTLKVSNTDLLNTRAFDNAWATSTKIKVEVKPPAPPPGKNNDTEDTADVNQFGVSIKCPMEAQEGGDIGAEDCTNWLVEDDGKKVQWKSESAFTLGKQRKTFFSEITETIILKKAQMSTVSVGLMDDLDKLQYLDLSYNMFRDLPSLGLASAFLEELDVSWNQLETLNIYTLRDMVKLRVLRADHNQIRFLEPNTFEMMVLEQLYLSNNLLSELPQGLFTTMPGSMIFLQNLDLSHNNLQILGDANIFNYSANLIELLLHGNPLRDVKPFYTALTPFEVMVEGPTTTEAKPAKTPIKCDPLSKLEKLTMDFSLGESIEPHMFRYMRNMKHLDLTVSVTAASQLTLPLFQPISSTLLTLRLMTTDAYRIPANFLSTCKSLHKIEWSESGLVSIEKYFAGLENLQTLKLNGNQIAALSVNAFSDLKNLENLDLSGNLIEYISLNTFKYTPKLKNVWMSQNRLTFIEYKVWTKLHDPENDEIPLSERPKLDTLKLDGNPLDCVPVWMEGPESKWAKSIQTYEDLYGPPPGFCTLCAKGQFAASFENDGMDCQPCPAGAICPYDHDMDKGTFPWTMIWCEPGQWVEAGEGLSIDNCVACPAGYYCPGEGEQVKCSKLGEVCTGGCIDKCEQCPKGSIANDLHTECLACDPGKYSEDGLRCALCPAGRYGSTPGLTNDSCSGICAIGHYCPPGSVKPEENKCPAGTYGDREGLGDAWCSGLCEIGTYCPEASTSRLGIVCPAGRYGEKPGLKDSSCSGPCSPEHYCPISSVSPDNMKCSAGLISRVGDHSCFECPPDHYSHQRRVPCSKCRGSRTFNASILDIHSATEVCLTCPLGQYNLTLNPGSITEVSECRECPPGTYNNKWHSVTVDDCKPCPVNTWSDVPGIASMYLCNKCRLGTFSNVLGATSETTCKHCPPGKYFHEGYDEEVARDADLVCHWCPPGSWTDGSDGICHLCELGLWSDKEGRTKPCYEVCDDGYLCPEGSHSPRMFVVPQGNHLPILEHAFWIGSFLSWVLSFTVILFRAV